MPNIFIRINDAGPDVRKLQTALFKRGFNPGAIDGKFGGGTQAALTGFQKSSGLLPDGIAGPRTLTKLGLTNAGVLPDFTGEVSVQVVSRMCPATPISNIQANWPSVLTSLTKFELHDRAMVLMAVATIRAETESFLPISEGKSRYNTSPNGHPFDLYDYRSDLGNNSKLDGQRYKGRGFIQLTGRYNYQQYGPRLSPPVDLESNPELANATSIAADLLGLFLADREVRIKEALLRGDLRRARRLINGGEHGLDRFEEAYQIGTSLFT